MCAARFADYGVLCVRIRTTEEVNNALELANAGCFQQIVKRMYPKLFKE